MGYKLITIDMDDTLLTSAKEISEKNKVTIQKAMTNGTKVVLCSGRPHEAMYDYARSLGINGNDNYLITNGGAIIENMNGEIFYQKTLNNDFYREFVDFAKKYAFPYCVLDVQGNTYTSNFEFIDKYTIDMAYENNRGLYIKEPEDLPVDFEITKGVINGNEQRLDEITDFINRQFSDYFVVRTGVGYLEVFPKNVNKGEAVKYLAQQLEIELNDVLAIGDRDNDISMLEIAGKGVAMGNAQAGVKAVSDYVTTDNNHDGVGNAIEKFVTA
ncbi:Cof-type HAD-IIB family hydrolase [Companilactobacillus sp. HBUAS56275]|uniref:Cof-type HAD-IIB family hydrolase n=1 Tax=Candidatus Companilactobacillus pullicola TaxID=2838523 RepID=A0A9D1ZQ98_9LACO|nr:Cof-type HAD-IIB family hydrolase [Candidatus Companilactobacillus pullicola]